MDIGKDEMIKKLNSRDQNGVVGGTGVERIVYSGEKPSFSHPISIPVSKSARLPGNDEQ